jgi:hypothetical protein
MYWQRKMAELASKKGAGAGTPGPHISLSLSLSHTHTHTHSEVLKQALIYDVPPHPPPNPFFFGRRGRSSEEGGVSERG